MDLKLAVEMHQPVDPRDVYLFPFASLASALDVAHLRPPEAMTVVLLLLKTSCRRR